MKTLGQHLTGARVATNRSLRHVAAAAEVAPSYLQHLEADRVHTPSPRHLKRLADTLGLDYVTLMRAAGYHMPGSDERQTFTDDDLQTLRDLTACLVRVTARLQALRS